MEGVWSGGKCWDPQHSVPFTLAIFPPEIRSPSL